MFTGLRVLELASVLAGPSVGQFFAELGAEVIKVENPGTGGDVTRSWKASEEKTDDRSAYFCSCNWGKKSIALDLTAPEDKSVVLQLAARSDIVIVSFKPGDAEKLGIGYDKLSGENPRLIYGQITGYGSSDERVGYDAVIQAESGFMDLNGEQDGPPVKMPVALIDVLAAHQLKEGLLLALLERERSKQGSFVEVSLLQAAISSLVNQATNWLVGGQVPSRQGSAHPNIAPYGDSFETKDGKRILLAVGSNRQFVDLLQMLGLDAAAAEKSFSSNQQRVMNRAALNKILAGRIVSLTSEELMKNFQQKKIPAGLIRNVKEVMELPQALQILLKSDDRAGVRQLVARSFPPDGQLLPPPHLGEHTKEILAQLGLSAR